MSELVRKNEYVAKSDSLLSVILSNQCSFFKLESFLDLLSNRRLLLNHSEVFSDVEVCKDDLVTLLTSKDLEPPVNVFYALVFEDDYLFVINKPSNLPIHPAGIYYFNTLTYLLTQDGFASNDKLFPVNRLDKETSGLVLFAKSSKVAFLLQKLFGGDSVEKIYESIVFGKTEKLFKIDAPLEKKLVGSIRDRMIVGSLGLPCKTSFFTLKQNNSYSYLQVFMHTGRRHQIRAHLAYLGNPIVGDKQYGSYPDIFIRFVKDYSLVSELEIISKLGANRQLLHCKKISFKHPITGKIMVFKANIPLDFANFLRNNFK